MQKNIIKNIIIPIIIGLAYMFMEILYQSTTLKSMIIYFIFGCMTTVILLFIYERYDVCGWVTISCCGGLIAYCVYILLSNPNAILSYDAVYIIGLNWASIIIVGIVVKFFDKDSKLKYFNLFFRLSSIIFFVFYIFTLGYALFFDTSGYRIEVSGINLIPFSTIIPYITGTVKANINISIMNLLANILLFIPLGFHLSILLYKTKMFVKVGVLLIVPVFIELIQFIFTIGITDIDDVI